MNDDKNIYPTIRELIGGRKKFKKGQDIGIEIEIEGRRIWDTWPGNNTWHIVEDGSLRGEEAAEYILAHPIHIDEIPEALEELEELLEPVKIELSDRCGVHIHINIQDITFKELFNFAFLYLVMEDVLVSYCGASREGNLFCLKAKDAEYLIDKLIETKKENELGPLKNQEENIRYAAINFASIFKHGSLEFRALKTPKDFSEINTWARMLWQVKEASGKYNTPIEIIEDCSLLGMRGFIIKVMGDFTKTLVRNVPEIENKIRTGIRLMQDVAYTKSIKRPVIKSDLVKPKKVYKPGAVIVEDNIFLEEPEAPEADEAVFQEPVEGEQIRGGHRVNIMRGYQAALYRDRELRAIAEEE